MNKLKRCNICNGVYPLHKHNFDECYSLDIQWDMLVIETDFGIFKEKYLIDWFDCKNPFNNIEDESKWGNSIIQKYCNSKKYTCQWTTKLGEYVVKLLLILNGNLPIKKQKHKGYDPDIETNDKIYEVKTRNYNTQGTAGEKILGVSKKYAEVPKLYKKDVVIVLCGYQEIEGRDKFKLFGGGCDVLIKMLDFDKSMGFSYLECSELLKIITSKSLS